MEVFERLARKWKGIEKPKSIKDFCGNGFLFIIKNLEEFAREKV